MKFKNKINSTDFPLSFNSLKHLIVSIYKNKSPIRVFHNYFLKDILDVLCPNTRNLSKLHYIFSKLFGVYTLILSIDETYFLLSHLLLTSL